MWSGTRPVAMSSPPSPGGATRYMQLLGARNQKYSNSPVMVWKFTQIPPPHLSPCVFFVCVCVGGQCLLAVDIPGPSSSEEQQGPLLSAALETQASHPAQCRRDQGTFFFLAIQSIVSTKQFSVVGCTLEQFSYFCGWQTVEWKQWTSVIDPERIRATGVGWSWKNDHKTFRSES